MKMQSTRALTECGIMLALAFVLSSIPLFKMPMGGSVTLASMVPIFLVSFKYGPRWGFPIAFLYAGLQSLQAVIEGDVFPYCETVGVVILVLFFDYLLPFTALGIASFFMGIKTKSIPRLGYYIGIGVAVFLRFLCHFVSGYFVWKQWAPEGMGAALYSFLYNGGFLLPELVIALIVAVLLVEHPDIRKLLDKKD